MSFFLFRSAVFVRSRAILAGLVFACLTLSTFIPLPSWAQAQAQVQVQPAASRLEPVVVTATRSPQVLSSVLGDLSVIDQETIAQSGASDVADLLARLPGIEFSRNGGPGTTTSVFIRGSETHHTAVYIDGVRLDTQTTGGAAWEQIPLDQIERIEVLRGPAAAVYGSDAIAGVVQLFTRRGKGPARPRASLTLGSYDTAQAHAGVSGSAEMIDYSLSAGHASSRSFDARTAAAPGHNPDKDGWRRSSVSGRVGFQVNPAHRFDIALLASDLRAEYDGDTPNVMDDTDHTLRTGHLAWEGRWSENATTRAQLGHTQSQFETQPSFYRTQTTLKDITLAHEQRLGAQKLKGTLERREDQLFNPATAFGSELRGQRHQDAVGLGWQVDWGAHNLQAHWRHDDDSEFGGKSTSSVAWGWAFKPQWRVSASTATSFRAPTLYQRFSEYGKPSLIPETGRNVELGLRWTQADKQANQASLIAWRNKLSNLITFGDPGPCVDSFGCFANVGRTVLRGVTLAGRTTWHSLALRGSIDWHDPRNLDNDKLLQRRAQRMATLGIETWLAHWSLGTEVQAAGMRYEDAANTQAMGGYTLVNLVASKSLSPDLTLEVRLDNLGNKNYELAQTYATAGRNGQITLRWATP